MLESIHARHAAERSQERCVVSPSRRHDPRDCSSRHLTTVARSQCSVFFAGSFIRYVAKHLPTPRTASTRAQSREIASKHHERSTQPPVRRACKAFAISAERLLYGHPREAPSPEAALWPPRDRRRGTMLQAPRIPGAGHAGDGPKRRLRAAPAGVPVQGLDSLHPVTAGIISTAPTGWMDAVSAASGRKAPRPDRRAAPSPGEP